MKQTLSRCWQAVPKHGCSIIFKNCLTNQHLKVKVLLVTCIIMQTVYHFSLLNLEFIIIFIMHSPTNLIYPLTSQPSQQPDNLICNLNLCFPHLIKIWPTHQHTKKKQPNPKPKHQPKKNKNHQTKKQKTHKKTPTKPKKPKKHLKSNWQKKPIKKPNNPPAQNNLKNTNPKPIAEAMPTVTPVAQAQDVWRRFIVKNSFKAKGNW